MVGLTRETIVFMRVCFVGHYWFAINLTRINRVKIIEDLPNPQ